MPSDHPAPDPSGRVYLDTASAAPLHPAARQTLLAALDRGYGDPRRLHGVGRDARLLLDNARAVVAECLGVHADEVAFTGSGAEATQRGLLGLVRARHGGPRTGVVHSPVEHSAVLHSVAWSPSDAHRLVGVDRHGRVDPAEVARAASEPGIAAVALQAANQEIGTRQPVDELDLPGDVALFVDAGAAAGHLPVPRQFDTLAAGASSWGGPAGVGVLVVRRGVRWANPFPGEDAPEGDGYLDVPNALAAAAALQAVDADRAERTARQHALVDRIRTAAAALPDTEVVGDPVERLPHLVTFSCLYVPGDELVAALDRRGFAVASGSACTASTLEPSHVLAAIGALTHGNLRVSVGPDTTEDDVDRFCVALESCLAELRRGVL